eukprot:Skav231032  [mRNA]  locus=scaffold1869:214547:216266:- [translate_table: standard]
MKTLYMAVLAAACLSRIQRSAGPDSAKSLFEKAAAFYFVSEMLQQLATIMQPLSKRFLHRDANSQNILVQASSGRYDFGLIDFGLVPSSELRSERHWQIGRLRPSMRHPLAVVDGAGLARQGMAASGQNLRG